MVIYIMRNIFHDIFIYYISENRGAQKINGQFVILDIRHNDANDFNFTLYIYVIRYI